MATTTGLAPRRRSGSNIALRRNRLTGIALTAPAMIAIAITVLFPLLWTVSLSFQSFDLAVDAPPASFVGSREQPSEEYVIGPMDQLNIFVWRNPELSAKVQVRPDGRITTPLVNDMPAVGKTPAMLADDMKIALSTYIKDPIVSVIVESPQSTDDAVKPASEKMR